jgi:hypothetical protein
MSKFITPELLDRYLKGQCDAEEIEQVHHWINLYSNDDAKRTNLAGLFHFRNRLYPGYALSACTG